MSDASHIVCPHCTTVNRVPRERPGTPNCGKCHRPLFDGNPTEADEAAFQKHLANTDILVLVDFWAPWCGPCKLIAPTIDAVATEYAGKVRVGKLNTDDNPQTASSYNISAIPTVLLFKGGEIVDKFVGVVQKNTLTNSLNTHIG